MKAWRGTPVSLGLRRALSAQKITFVSAQQINRNAANMRRTVALAAALARRCSCRECIAPPLFKTHRPWSPALAVIFVKVALKRSARWDALRTLPGWSCVLFVPKGSTPRQILRQWRHLAPSSAASAPPSLIALTWELHRSTVPVKSLFVLWVVPRQFQLQLALSS